MTQHNTHKTRSWQKMKKHKMANDCSVRQMSRFVTYFQAFMKSSDMTIYNKYVCLCGRLCIHTCRGRAHTLAESPSVEETGVYQQYMPPHAHPSDFVFLEEQSSPKWEIPCSGRRWTTVQNLTPLALSSPEKSVTIQTQKKTKQKDKQKTVNDISTPCLSACVDNQLFTIKTTETSKWHSIHHVIGVGSLGT